MTLLELRSTMAVYLQKTVPDLTVNGVDLTILALNNVRRKAEMLHDFEFSRRHVTVTVDGLDGGTLDDVIQEGSPTCEVKTVIECGVYDDGWNIHPLEWTTVAESLERQRQVKPGYPPRYPTDGSATVVDGGMGLQRIAFCGNDVWCIPRMQPGLFDVEIEAYTFQQDWSATSDSVVVSGVLGGAAMNGSYWPYGIFNQRALYLNFLSGAPVAMDAIWYVPGEWKITPIADVGKATGALANYQVMVATTMMPSGTYVGHGTFSGQGIVTAAPGSDTSDVWLSKGSQYLLWAGIVEVNHLCKEFVFRQEGNLPPPQDMADSALETFRQWDSFRYEQDRRHVY